MSLTIETEILYKTMPGIPQRMDNIADSTFLEIAVLEVTNVSPRVATATSSSCDMKEDRGHVGGLFQCCSDHVFYFLGEKEKKAIGRKKK